MKVEQTNWMTMESALEPSDDDDIPEMKSYAYVTFLHAEGAAEAMKKEKIQIFSSTCEIHKAFTWHQPEPELDAYKATHQSLSPRLETFYNQILNALNDDCILHIMNSTSLNILDVSQMMEFHPRFNAIAENIRTVNFNPPLLQGITLWEFYKILRLQGFGHRVANLTISAKIFNSAVTDDVFLLLNQYLGPQVLKLTLNSFGLTNKQFDQLKPIFRRLNYFDIDLRYSFDFKSFHFTWNNLRTLRIRTSGFMEDFPDQANTFPVLKELMIVCGYRLHERLFERLHRSCGQIIELAIITPDEYVSELSPRRIDLENLEKFKGLTKLHLSFSRTYFRTNILDVITKLKTLKYLTLEISTPLERQPEDTLFNEFNKKLRTIGVMMPELKELRLASIRLEEFRIIEMIKCAPQLESLWIVDIGIEMERFMLLIMKIVEARKFIFEDKPIVPLKLTVINFTDEVLESVRLNLCYGFFFVI